MIRKNRIKRKIRRTISNATPSAQIMLAAHPELNVLNIVQTGKFGLIKRDIEIAIAEQQKSMNDEEE